MALFLIQIPFWNGWLINRTPKKSRSMLRDFLFVSTPIRLYPIGEWPVCISWICFRHSSHVWWLPYRFGQFWSVLIMVSVILLLRLCFTSCGAWSAFIHVGEFRLLLVQFFFGTRLAGFLFCCWFSWGNSPLNKNTKWLFINFSIIDLNNSNASNL